MVLVPTEHDDLTGDEGLLDFSFASPPTLTPEQTAARRLARAERSSRAAHAFRCAELDGREPIASAAAAQIGGAL